METKLKNWLDYLWIVGVVVFFLMLFLDAPVRATIGVLVLSYSVMIVVSDSSTPLKAANLIIAFCIAVAVLTM